MYKKIVTLIFSLFLISNISLCQTITFQGGLSRTDFDWKFYSPNGKFYDFLPNDEPLKSYAFFLGMDYLDKKFLGLSSNIGLIRKGGGNLTFDYEEPYPDETYLINLDYLSINTTINIKVPIKEKIIPFVSIGPRVDFLIGSSPVFDFFEEKDKINLSYGIIYGAGLKYILSQIEIGIRMDFYKDIDNLIGHKDVAEIVVKSETMTTNITIGYKIN